jgi:PAS domain S-box-containing protein
VSGLLHWKDLERKDVLAMAALGAVYGLTGFLSLRLALVDQNVTPLWPPTGIAVVAFLLFGTRLWPGIAVAAFIVNLPITSSPLAAAATAAGNTIAPIVAVQVLRLVGFRTELDRVRDVVSLLVVAPLTMSVSATIGATTLLVTDQISAADYWQTWAVWWAGDSMGVLVVAPLLLVVWNQAHGLYRSPKRFELLELVGVLSVLVVISLLAVTATVSVLFLVLPVVGWAAWRFQLWGAAPAALLVSSAATWAAVQDRGPFEGSTLLDKMITLQGFNATVAFTAFFLAALVAERARSREALERGAADLEVRVERRTEQLSDANRRLAGQITERREAESRLRRSERQLAEAHEMARIGSWEWDVASGEVAWSEEMFRIHGLEPDVFEVTFERAMTFVHKDDRARIREDVEALLAGRRDEIPDREYRIVLPDGEVRTLHARSKLSLAPDGMPVRVVGIAQDVTEHRAFEREHRIADTLQQALLPASFPEVEGVEVAARYVPAETGLAAGGDWFDVIPLAGGRVALVIGDVAGHGLEAASLMGQLRLAVRAYALEGHPPGVIAERTDALLHDVAEDEMATLLLVVLDVASRAATTVGAGHPRPIAISSSGARLLPVESAPPLGLGGRGSYPESTMVLEPRTTLLLYTDGLIDRPDLPIDEGIDRLLRAAEDNAHAEMTRICEGVLSAMVHGDASDDIALLALRLLPVDDGELRLRVPAEPKALQQVRRRLRRWLETVEAPDDMRDDVVVATSEAVSNSIRHAYGPSSAWVEIEAELAGGEVEVVVRDRGRWRPPRGAGGRGIDLMQACMASVEIEQGPEGTVVRMRRPVRSAVAP